MIIFRGFSPQATRLNTSKTCIMGRWGFLEQAMELKLLKLSIPVLMISLVLFLWFSYNNAETEAAAEVRNVSVAFASQLDSVVIQEVELALQDAVPLIPASALSGVMPSSEASDALLQITRRYPNLSFVVTNKYGEYMEWAALSGDLATPLPAATLNALQDAWGNARQPGPFYSLVESKGILTASVPLIDAQRNLAGWATVELPLSVLENILLSFKAKKHEVLSVRSTIPGATLLSSVDTNLHLRASHPDRIDRFMDRDRSEGVSSFAKTEGAPARLYGFRQVGQSTLRVVVGLSPDDYLAEWRYGAILAACFTLVFILAVLTSIHYFRRHQSNDRVAASTLRAHEVRTRLLVDGVGQAIFCLDVDGHCNYLNRACSRLFGVDQHRMIDPATLNAFFSDCERATGEAFAAGVIKTVSNQNVCYFESTLLHLPDGRMIPIEVHGYAYHSDHQFLGAVLTLQDISERQRHEQEIHFLAYHDALTQLPNRPLIRSRFDTLTARAEGLALVYLDIDHFKTINDSLGHESGDNLLRVIAGRLSALEAPVDMVARLGGDEFLLLATAPSMALLQTLMESIVRAVTETCEFDNYQLTITPSMGVSTFP